MEVIVETGTMYTRLLRRHMVKEDDVFFPMAERRLTPVDWRDVEYAIQASCEDPDLSARLDRIDSVARAIEAIMSNEGA